MSITPERIAEIRLALQDLGRGIHRYSLDLRGNGVASLVTELLDDAQRYETAYEHQVAEVKRLREQVASLTPRWQEGEPPLSTWVWREVPMHFSGEMTAKVVRTFPHMETGACLYGSIGEPHPWGTARWAPIHKPVEG